MPEFSEHCLIQSKLLYISYNYHRDKETFWAKKYFQICSRIIFGGFHSRFKKIKHVGINLTAIELEMENQRCPDILFLL